MKKESILIVDDQPEILNALERLLKEEYKIHKASSGLAGIDILKKQDVAVILADQRMPGMTGVEFLSQALSLQPHTVRILITAYADITASIEAVNKGQIYSYISKPWEPDDLQMVIHRAVERYKLQEKNVELTKKLKEANEQLRRENIILKQSITKEFDFSNIIGHSPRMLQVFKLVSKVIETPTTVMLLGETGTGKEMIARAIHFNGPRKDKMFVAQNCGALPDSLLESELFGHIRGSFTGAISDRKGIFELANNGTVFLDEIADTTPALQLRLLRVLQEGEIKPVGGSHSISVDVRIIAATNKNLEELVKEGNFREDLYYRLNVFPIILPPLHERREDISDLVNHFIHKYAVKIGKQISGVSPEAMEMLHNARYPGNIRELENEIERAVTLADDGAFITPELISLRFQKIQMQAQGQFDLEQPFKQQVQELEIKLIKMALNETAGNVLQAAEKLKLSRAGLHKKLNRYHIDPKNM
jgi:two-component system response regulator HupR/HoxA